jgi:hypothetical protein
MAYAFTYCMYATMPINVGSLIGYAKQWSSQGYIDNLSNLNNARVFLYSGTQDTVVNPKVMQALDQMYQQLVPNGTLRRIT